MRPPHSEAGFTIIEVLVTALIVAVMGSGIALALGSAAHATGNQRMSAEADALVAQDQERMRGLSDEQLAALGGSGQNHTETADGFQFTINSKTAAVSAQGVSSCISGGASDYQVTSTVGWSNGTSSQPGSVSASSLIARPTTGDLLAVVEDQTGQPLPGASIATTAGPGSAQGTTDTNGCSLFAGLAAGGYTIQASMSGYVDPTGNPTPTLSTPVTAIGTPTANSFSLGLAGTITANFATSSGAAGEATAVSYASTGNATPKTTTPGAATTSVTTPSLYPFDVSATATPSYQNNYTVWAGACPQQAPATPTTASVTPGSAQNLTVNEPALLLSSVTNQGTAVTPTALKLSFASLTGTTCTASWSAAVATATGPGVPPATGWLADPGQPYADGTSGRLTICAAYTNTSGTTVSGQVTAVNSRLTAANLAGPIVLNRTGGC